MRQSAISINNLYKSFGNKEVIHDLSFNVKEGEIFAFLGANGSEKATSEVGLLGALSLKEALFSGVVVLIYVALGFYLSFKLFELSSLEYSQKLSSKRLLKRRQKN